ncbi:hypothetical protein [Nocardiopsis halotolerans]|uniref:hypothetical protein n=1 Tax=Nocardiopsis halotolerans TaxID=124252 RepID=UPI000349AC75|nr:hypothetical protein [Nocardiopsis halotolerans]
MADGDGLFVDTDGLSRNSWSVYDAAEYAQELQQWLNAELEPLGDIWGEGDEFAEQMEKSLGVLRTSIDQYLGFLAIATRDTSAILGQTRDGFVRGEEENVDNVPDLDPSNVPGGRR